MDTTPITNEIVKQAIDALQAGDKTAWYTLFTEDPEFTDDGNKRDFRTFFDNAIGREYFLSIDEITDNGRSIVGDFNAGQWGTFKVYFRFHLNTANRINRLDIGQVSKLRR